MSPSSVPEGQDLVAFFAALPLPWVDAAGVVEGVEIALQGPEGEVLEALGGRWTLVSLAGPSVGPLFGVFARSGAITGGRVVKARSAGVWFSMAPPPSGAPRTPMIGERAPAVMPRGVTPLAPGWDTLAAQSAAKAEEEEYDEVPKFGDRVDHFVFGLCDVMVVRGDRLKIRDVKGPGRLREIALGAVRVLPPVDEDGKKVFKLVKRG